ncbi:MAG: hypothetical protein ACFB0D_09635 [Phormidesmis sp.]
MSVTTPSETKFWIICHEENQLTQKLTKEINYWQIPGVRARLDEQMSTLAADTLTQSDYAIFVTLSEHPCSQIQLHPVSSAQTQSAQSPISFLDSLRERYGSAPQSWWLQLPLTEVCHQGIKHIPTEHTLSKALTQIEIFVRNYYLQPKLQQQKSAQSTAVKTEKALQVA